MAEFLKPFCEVMLHPALRALIAKELAEHYNFTQAQIAAKLGVTQPAVSQYLRLLRAKHVKELRRDKKPCG